MANSLNQNPIVIDTVMAQGYKAAVASSLGSLFTLKIDKVYWESPVTVGDKVTIVDPDNGNVILDLTCDVAGKSQWVDWTAHPKLVANFRVAVIGSGTLYVYTR